MTVQGKDYDCFILLDMISNTVSVETVQQT